MRILTLGDGTTRQVHAHGSSGFEWGALTEPGARVMMSTATLEPGGTIGRHDAHDRQLLILLSGSVTVVNGDGGGAALMPGQAAVCEAGESHEARTDGGATLLFVEGAFELR